jgi:hypothetical protein
MKFRKILIVTLILLVVSDALLYIGNMGIENEFIAPVSLAAKLLVLCNLIYFARKSNWTDDLSKTVSVLFKLVLCWNILTVIRGVFLAHDYWDWRFLILNSGFFFLIPLAFFIGKSMSLTKAVIHYVAGYLFLFGFFAIPIGLLTNQQLYSRLMIPVSFFIVMIPYLKTRYKYMIVIVAITSILVVIDFRTNIVKIGISFLILFTWYLRRYISVLWLKFLHPVIFFAPFVLLFLGISGEYNIFSKASENDSYVVKDHKSNVGEDESMTADTRTFGALLYALLLFVVSHNAIYHSNNWLSKMLGLVILSRWVLFFMEEFTQFDLNFCFLWIIIGLVSTKQFRSMTDAQIADYLSNIKRKVLNVRDELRRPLPVNG